MARVIKYSGEESVLVITGDPIVDAYMFASIVGGGLEVSELSPMTCMLYNGELSWDDEGVEKFANAKATRLLQKEYGIIMPLLGSVIIIDVEDLSSIMGLSP